MYRTAVTICTTSLKFANTTFCPHSVFMCFVWISEQTAIISLYNINLVVSLMAAFNAAKAILWVAMPLHGRTNLFYLTKTTSIIFLTSSICFLRCLCSVSAFTVRDDLDPNLNSYNESQQDALFLKFILIKNSTCFGQVHCPSSAVSEHYTQQ
jgi:hypothetical protein